jgi:hypothetical protein
VSADDEIAVDESRSERWYRRGDGTWARPRAMGTDYYRARRIEALVRSIFEDARHRGGGRR